jgi:hypothetical protein
LRIRKAMKAISSSAMMLIRRQHHQRQRGHGDPPEDLVR